MISLKDEDFELALTAPSAGAFGLSTEIIFSKGDGSTRIQGGLGQC